MPHLATSLNNLANMQSAAGHGEAALATAEEAVRLRRELAVRNRDAFMPHLATSLNNLANVQSAAGHWDAALATAEEAVHLRRELAGRNRDAFAEGLAKACGTLGDILIGLGRHAEAAQLFAEGIRTILPGMRRYPAPYLDLCVTLLRGYLSSAEEATIGPDETLMEEVMTVIGPYLKKEEGEKL
jgi:tetratricopeptide (TPR) repeat protein